MKQERYHAAPVGRSKAGSLGHPTTPIHIHCIARLVGDDDDDQDGDNDDHYSHDDHDTMLGPLLGHPNLPPSTASHTGVVDSPTQLVCIWIFICYVNGQI